MEQLRIPKLLAGALAAVSGAVIASFFGVEGTLIGAALVSLLVTPAEAVYSHSLTSAHQVARRSLLRRVGDQADSSEEGASEDGASEEGASQAQPQPIRWQRVAVAAVLAFGIAVAAITGVEAVANQPLASLVGTQPRQGGSTSVGVVVAGGDRSTPPATRAPGRRPRRRRGRQQRRRRRLRLPPRPRRRRLSPAARPYPQLRLARRPQLLGGSDAGLEAYLERPAAPSWPSRRVRRTHRH